MSEFSYYRSLFYIEYIPQDFDYSYYRTTLGTQIGLNRFKKAQVTGDFDEGKYF